MRLEVLVGQGDPQIFPLSKPKIVIGSSDVCDIVLPAEQISRKHLIVIIEEDHFYVVDQGSTNGSFINEERLVPGRRTEFTSFFPVRLGDNVLITLLSDEETQGMDFTELNVQSPPILDSKPPTEGPGATRVINLKDLQKTKTETLVKQRQEIVARKKLETKRKPVKKKNPDKMRMQLVMFVSVVIFGAGIYYKLYVKKFNQPVTENIAKVGEETPVRIKQRPEVAAESSLLDDADLTSHSTFDRLLSDFKCMTDLEKQLCRSIAGAIPDQWGVTQVGTMLNVMIDGTPYFKDAKKFYPPPFANSPDLLKAYEGDVAFIAAALFIQRGVPMSLKYSLFKKNKFSFALFIDRKTKVAIAVKPQALKKVKEVLALRNMVNLKKFGKDYVRFTKDFYRVY